MSALIPYGASTTLTLAQARRVNRAIALGKFAWQNRQAIAGMARYGLRAGKRTARRFTRARKRRRMFRSVGFKPGTGRGKKTNLTYNTTNQNLSTRVLSSEPLVSIARQTGDRIDRRDRDIANIRGIKFCWEIRNASSSPMYFNWAILIPKQGTSADVSDVDFFREFTDTRAVTFSTSLTANDFHCRPINADKYRVITHKRMILGPANGVTNTTFYEPNRPSYRNINKYVKIKRQFRFDQGDSNPEGQQPVVCWWCDNWGNPGGTASAAAQVVYNRRDVIFWKEPKA